MAVKKEKIMQLKEDYKGMPEGSTFYLESETKTLYKGLWCSMMGSYHVSVPKKKCKRYKKEEIKIDYSSPAVKKILKTLIPLLKNMR